MGDQSREEGRSHWLARGFVGDLFGTSTEAIYALWSLVWTGMRGALE